MLIGIFAQQITVLKMQLLPKKYHTSSNLPTVLFGTFNYCVSNTIQYNTIQYNTIQYNTIQYNTIQYNTIQYNTIPNIL